MATGLLRVEGTIDVTQFWPQGSADADTTKIQVEVAAGAFRFRPNENVAFRTTNAFDDAIVIGRARRNAIDNQSRITVRLQGIDAAELHYRPPSHLTDRQGRTSTQRERYLEVNEEYRQFLAETATVRLAEFLSSVGPSPIACVVESAVDEPDEVFDTYGRFVGDIVVTVGNQDRNVNQWLVQHGLAYPAFYNSMSYNEITTLRALADEAWYAQRPVWPNLADYVGRLDWDLQYRRPSSNPVFTPADDVGLVVLPKLFRRLSTWEVNRYAGMVTSAFWSYLESRRDDCHLTSEFLAEPTAAPVHYLHEYLHLDGYFDLWPEELVFREAPSRLIRPGGGTVNW